MSHVKLPSLDTILQQGLLISTSNQQLLLAWGNLQKAAQFLHGTTCFWVSDFFLETKTPWWKFENVVEISKNDFLNYYNLKELERFSVEFEEPHLEEWQNTFSQLQNLITDKKIEKLVPIVQAQAQVAMDSVSKQSLLFHLLKNSDEQFIYAIFDHQMGLVGITPERLFYKNAHVLNTMALAGTDNSESPEGSLLNNPKEMKEHGFVIDAIVSSLNSFGEIKVLQTYEWQLDPLKHLRTDIELECNKEVSWMHLLNALHPTPALGTYPRECWLEYKALLNSERKYFGAPIGYSHNGVEQAFVAIRNIFWNGEKMILSSGCGIVAESDCEKEWKELELKRMSVKKRLGL